MSAERDRRSKLAALESSRDENARDADARLAENSAESGETFGGQLGRGILGGLAGSLVSNIDTELGKNKINATYDGLLSRNSAALKLQHERRSAVLNTLKQRCSLTTK